MNIALLSNEGGGISSVTYGLAYSLSKRKIRTTVFTGTNDRLGTEKINSYLDIVRLPGFDLPPRALWLQLRNLRLLSRLPLKFTVIHGVSPYTSLAYAFLKRKEQKPFITTIHGTPRGALKAFANSPVFSWTPSDFGVNVVELPLNDFTIKKCITSSDHVVVCSYVALNELRAYYNIKTSKFSVIHNGINFNEIENVKIGIDKNNQSDFVILYAGRLFWMKGIMFLLKAFEILHEHFRSIELNILGKGPLEKEIKRFISRAGLTNCIHLKGHVPHRDLIAEIKKSDVVAFPSLYESQPMVGLEAMACKKPLVLFDLPYAREFVGNGCGGILVKTYNIADLSEKLELLLLDEGLRFNLGQSGYEYVNREHNWDDLVDKYICVYRNAFEKLA